jgi:hypothetical protein
MTDNFCRSLWVFWVSTIHRYPHGLKGLANGDLCATAV